MRIYRASGLGGCMKAQIAEHLGFTALSTEKKMQEMANEGELHEKDIYTKKGCSNSQDEVVMEIMPGVQVVGHIDGITPLGYVLEVKSMGDDSFRKFMDEKWDTPGLVQKYKWQMSVYMLGTNRPMLFVAKNRNTGKTYEETFETPFYSRGDILTRVVSMERWVRRGELPDDCSFNNYPCPFYYLEQQQTLEMTEDEVMDELARMYKDAQVAVKAAERRKVEARKALDSGLAGRERVVTALSKITYYEVSTKKIDWNKMAEDGVDIKKYEVPTIGKRLRVTVRDDDQDELGGDGERTPTD